MLAGPNRARSSHARTCTRTRTRTTEHATASGQADAAGRSVPRRPGTQRRADMRHVTDPHDPDGPRAHQPAAQPHARAKPAGSRSPADLARECGRPGAPAPRRHPVSLDPRCRTHAPPGRPEHLPPSWRLQGSGAGGRDGGRGRGLGAGSGAGSGWEPLQRPRLGPHVCPAVSPTAQSLRRPPPPPSHMPALAGGPVPANQGCCRPDGRPAAPPPVLQLSSPPPASAKGERCGRGRSRRSLQ